MRSVVLYFLPCGSFEYLRPNKQVLRTRLRQPSVNGVVKYTGLWQTLQLVIKEEGARSLYGGLSAHLMRVVPNAAVMYSIYEGFIRWGEGW